MKYVSGVLNKSGICNSRCVSVPSSHQSQSELAVSTNANNMLPKNKFKKEKEREPHSVTVMISTCQDPAMIVDQFYLLLEKWDEREELNSRTAAIQRWFPPHQHR